MSCKHRHGDYVKPLGGWVCGQCFKILPERPQRLGMVRLPDHICFDGPVARGDRQDVVWQADIRKSKEGTTLAVFLAAMARRFIWWGWAKGQADGHKYALESLKMMGEEFGAPDYDWSRTSAIDIVDEEISYGGDGESAENA